MVRDNTVNGNLHQGIVVSEISQANTLEANTAYGNGLLDVADANPGCVANTWTGNLFGTSDGCP